MKTAEELWTAYMDDKYTTGDVMYYEDFIKALTEHDKEIISKIDEMVKEKEILRVACLARTDVDEIYKLATKNTIAGWIAALTELKQWIQGEVK